MLASMKLGVSERARACLIGLTIFTAHTIAREMRSEERDFVVVFILEWGEDRDERRGEEEDEMLAGIQWEWACHRVRQSRRRAASPLLILRRAAHRLSF